MSVCKYTRAFAKTCPNLAEKCCPKKTRRNVKTLKEDAKTGDLMNPSLIDLQYEASKSLQFLDNHPALISNNMSFLQNQIISMEPVSKYNEGDMGPCCLRRSDPKFEEFKLRFDKDEDYIYVNHQELYGEPWKYDHMRYYYEASFCLYMGKMHKQYTYDPEWYKNWHRYQGIHGYGSTFEEALTKCANEVKEYFGVFDNSDSLLTSKENNNHNRYSPFYFKRSKTIIHNPISGKDEKTVEMKHNKMYIDVTPEMINRRWLKWFAETPYCRKNWKNEFDKLIKKTPDWVWG